VKKGGLLDRFPFYILTGKRSNKPIVVIDSTRLGKLHPNSVPECPNEVIVISKDIDRLRETREVFRSNGGLKIHPVLADPENLPFRDGSIEGLLTLPVKRDDADRNYKTKSHLPEVLQDVKRVLSPSGWMLVVEDKTDGPFLYRWDSLDVFEERQHFLVTPRAGRIYFVIQDGFEREWPFTSIHVGRMLSLWIGINLILNKVRGKTFREQVRLSIYFKSSQGGIVQLIQGERKSEKLSHPIKKNVAFFVKAGWNAILIDCDNMEMITKFPLSHFISRKMSRHADNLIALGSESNPSLKKFIPKIVKRGDFYGQQYLSETLIEGFVSSKFWWKPGWQMKTVYAGFDFISNLHQGSRKDTRINRDHFEHLTINPAMIVKNEAKKVKETFSLEQLLKELWRVLQDRNIPLVRTHGDFWAGNLIVSGSCELQGVLDWDESDEYGWPVIDLLHLITYRRKWRTDRFFGDFITGRLMHRRLKVWERELADRYFTSMGIDEILWPQFVALYWLVRASQLVGVYDEGWIYKNVVKPLRDITNHMAKA
jgi:hypothetical protein